LCCKEVFVPDARSRRWQEFCSKAECRKASKAARQRRWVAKNRDYWRGKEHVERVRAWRARNPGYATRRRELQERHGRPQKQGGAAGERLREKGKGALQDDCRSASVLKRRPKGCCAGAALQDDWVPNDPLLVGLIAMVAKGALQDDIASACRVLIAKGREILAAHTRDGSVHGKAQF